MIDTEKGEWDSSAQVLVQRRYICGFMILLKENLKRIKSIGNS